MTGRQVGYIRVSTVTQTHDQQRDALIAAGVQDRDIFAEKVSGAAKDRPEFTRMLAYVESGDTITVASFDRFGRNTAEVFRVIEELTAREVFVRGLRENVDTSTASGQLVAGLLTVIAAYERILIKERTDVARNAARKRGGKVGGQQPKLTPDQVAKAVDLREKWTVSAIARDLGVGRATLYRYLKEHDARELQTVA